MKLPGPTDEKPLVALTALLRAFETNGLDAHEATARDGPWLCVALLRIAATAAVRDAGLPAPKRVRGGGGLFDEDAWPMPRGVAPGAKLAREVLSILRPDGAARSLLWLGDLHESLLGLSVTVVKEDSVLLRAASKPSAPPVEPLVGLASLLSLSGPARVARLDQDGIALAKRMAATVSGATTKADLAEALSHRVSPIEPGVLAKGRLAIVPTSARRRAGAHYTPRAIADRIVLGAIEPLVEHLDADQILELRVCDPAMGSGALLVAACELLGARLVAAWERSGAVAPGDPHATSRARRLVAEQCLFGVDVNPLTVAVARFSLWLVARGPSPSFVDRALVCGDALIGRPTPGVSRAPLASFHWDDAFPTVHARGGFDAFVGNPPWVSWAGRAAQPLDDARRRWFTHAYQAFAGYRNLQGLFVERCASLLRAGGRLGLLIPSSMSEQHGYAPVRRAHDRLAQCDPVLPDVGDGSFAGVFQPCMLLLSTARAAPEVPASAPWPVERPDLDVADLELLTKLARPCLPPHLFGERGVQTSGEDVAHLAGAPDAHHTVPLRAGGDVEAFRLAPPSFHAHAAWFGRRLRTPDAWSAPRLVIRQTARFPIAALSDGRAFRNSLLAGFEDERHPAAFLVAYLNSTPIRWLHWARHRDARQGMPQVKVGHLRATPAPPTERLVAALCLVGAELSRANDGVCERSQARIDGLVAEAFEISKAERDRLAAWRERVGVVQRLRPVGCSGSSAA